MVGVSKLVWAQQWMKIHFPFRAAFLSIANQTKIISRKCQGSTRYSLLICTDHVTCDPQWAELSIPPSTIRTGSLDGDAAVTIFIQRETKSSILEFFWFCFELCMNFGYLKAKLHEPCILTHDLSRNLAPHLQCVCEREGGFYRVF